MKLKTKEFAAALAKVLPVMKTRTTLPILSCVKMEASEGRLKVTATDLDAYAAASCACEGDLAPLCVDAEIINHLVRQDSEFLNFEVLDALRLQVKGSGTAKLATHPAEEFPAWPDKAHKEINVSGVDLAESIDGVAWATDMNVKIALDVWRECVWVKMDKEALQCCGTNSKEFAYVNRPIKSTTPCEFMFPSKQAKLLVDSLFMAQSVFLSDSFISTDSESFRVAIKLADGKYIPLNFLLNQQQEPLGVLGAIEMAPILDSLHTIKAMGYGEAYLVCRLEFEPDAITIKFKSERGTFERSMERKFESKPSAINFDVARAIRVFSHVHTGARASLGSSSILFFDGDYTYALGLILGK